MVDAVIHSLFVICAKMQKMYYHSNYKSLLFAEHEETGTVLFACFASKGRTPFACIKPLALFSTIHRLKCNTGTHSSIRTFAPNFFIDSCPFFQKKYCRN
jgi:hypothetical protein